MSLSPYTTTLVDGSVASDADELYEVTTRGRRGLILVVDISEIGNGHSYLVSGALSLPVTIDASHNTFQWSGDAYTIANGTYNTAAALATAVAAATKAGPVALSAVVTVAAEGSTKLRFTAVATDEIADVFENGASNNALTRLGVTDGAGLNGAGADGAVELVPFVDGIDEASGNTWEINDGASLTTVGTSALVCYPPDRVLPARVRVRVQHVTTNEVTRSLAVQLIN